MRISKRVREEAARLCAIGASGPVAMFEVFEQLDPSQPAAQLAWDAFGFACRTVGECADRSRVVRAEAEAMLRTGWTP